MADAPVKKPAARKRASARKPRSNASKPAKEITVDHKTEAKEKFSKALDEAKAGAAELKAEAAERVGAYTGKARARTDDLTAEAREYGDQAKAKALELANEGKAKASEALAGLGKVVEENAPVLDEKLGPKYGDYARTASRSLQDTAAKIDEKQLSELAEDGREMVRKSPALAVGIAAAAGFLLASIFRRGK